MKKQQGFAVLSLRKRRDISRLGGKARAKDKKGMAKAGRKGARKRWRNHVSKA